MKRVRMQVSYDADLGLLGVLPIDVMVLYTPEIPATSVSGPPEKYDCGCGAEVLVKDVVFPPRLTSLLAERLQDDEEFLETCRKDYKS